MRRNLIFLGLAFGVMICIFLSLINWGWNIAAIVLVAAMAYFGYRFNSESCVVLELPAAPRAKARDRSTWAAAVLKPKNRSNGKVQLASVWDDDVEDDAFRVLCGPKPGKVVVVGAESVELVGTFRQSDASHQEPLK